MSADDSIEIEFPSLKQSAPKLVEGVEPKRAPGPIEAQLSSTSGDDDLSWLSAIFAEDDDDDEDDAAPKAEAGDRPSPDAFDAGPPDHTRAEPPLVPDRLLDDPPADLSEGPGGVFEANVIEDDDLIPPPADRYAESDTDNDTEDAAPDESETMVNSDQDPIVADGDPIDAGTDLNHPSSPSKKVTGFREEIMSTFSQMYN